MEYDCLVSVTDPEPAEDLIMSCEADAEDAEDTSTQVKPPLSPPPRAKVIKTRTRSLPILETSLVKKTYGKRRFTCLGSTAK